VREACGGRSGGGGGQQAGQERILLTQGFVGDDGDLTVAGRGDEGDDPATLEEAEDRLLARSTTCSTSCCVGVGVGAGWNSWPLPSLSGA